MLVFNIFYLQFDSARILAWTFLSDSEDTYSEASEILLMKYDQCKTFGEDELSAEERVPVSTARAAEHCMELGSNVKEISVKKL